MSNQSAELSGNRLQMVKLNRDWAGATEAIREFQEQMKLLNENWRSQLKLTQPSIGVTTEFSMQVSAILSSFRAVSAVQQEELAKFIATFAKTIGSMNLNTSAYQSEFKTIAAKISSVLNKPHAGFGVTTATYINATRPILEALKDKDSQISAILESVSSLKMAATTGIDTEALQKLSEYVAESEYDFHDVVISNDGTLAVAGVNVAVSELKDAFTESLNESGLLDSLRNLNATVKEQSNLLRLQNDRLTVQEEVINRLIQQVCKLKGTRLAWIMQNIVLSIIIGLMINNFASPLLQPYTDVPVQQIKKMMKVATSEATYDPVILTNHRYVCFNNLKLWEGSRMKSPVITRLKQGAVVRVLSKKRNWTCVMYIDEGQQEPIVGWTLTRYLSTFK
jgi:hypothetical protein